MRILFLHHTFPGPFRQLAARLGGLPGNEIVFLSERSRRDVWLPGVRNLTVSGVQPVMAKDRAERELMQMMRYGSRFANALLKLQQSGFEPDIVYAHPDGDAVFSRRIFSLRRSMPCMRNGIIQKGPITPFLRKGRRGRRGVCPEPRP